MLLAECIGRACEPDDEENDEEGEGEEEDYSTVLCSHIWAWHFGEKYGITGLVAQASCSFFPSSRARHEKFIEGMYILSSP